ncbi:MAG: endonuclease/exonuclease/phosphatase family protein, partial [Candidatus Thiodiazotropha endolucinida]|nr:endonuclease/exonuclease/phosphatase family protein [Candidatus Thiodiazotropha taylori]MCW4346446.1 endonuclease/exonuclease/phosphatase family protein [Candidatus Thiodiazotropha endolucinida]
MSAQNINIMNGSMHSDYDVSNSSSSVSLNINQDDSISNSSYNLNEKSSILHLGLAGKGMHIGHLNIQGLSSKIDELKLMLTSKHNSVHVLGLSESKLKDYHHDNLFYIDGYQKPIRKDRLTGGGGIIVYVKEGIVFKRRTDLETDELECVWVEICPKNSRPFLLCFMYRHPNSTVAWNESFENCIDKSMEEEKELYILGDFNRDLLNSNIKRNWVEFITQFGLSQMVTQATRVTPRSSTLIDHIYCNIQENCSNVSVPNLGISDHFPIFFTRKINSCKPKSKHYSISYRSFKNFNEENFKNDLRLIPWDIVKMFDDPNDALDTWSRLFLDVVNKHIPIKQHRVKHKTQPQWLTPEIIEAIKNRDRFKAIGNDAEFKVWRNKVTCLIRKSKKSRYEAFLEDENNPNNIWKLFKEVGASKKSSTKPDVQIS